VVAALGATRVTVGFERSDGYLPIAAYGLVGDCSSAALIGADGSIDWLCLPRFDKPSLFGRILDARRGGHWQICPTDEFRVVQRYRERTNILETVFSTATGTALVTDFMPVDEESVRRHGQLHRDPRMVRLVECLTGTVTIRHQFKPAPDYGAPAPRFLSPAGWGMHGDTATLHLCLQSTVQLKAATSRWRMYAGEAIALALRSDHPGPCTSCDKPWDLGLARDLARKTQEYWWDWVGRCGYQGPYQDPVVRSALCLKLMTYAPTGAIVAAPTTSLPEEVGGQRNWD
jgi:GH15 family glucan-1,4-alpha-glucosidase